MPTEDSTTELLLQSSQGMGGGFLNAPSLLLLLLSLIALGVAGLLSRASRAAAGLGIERSQGVARTAVIFKIIGTSVALFVLLRALAAPLSPSATLLLFGALFTTAALVGVLRDLAGSLYAQFRMRLGPGDRIAFEGVDAEVRSLHWDHVRLEATDGEAVLVPGRAFLGRSVRVQPLREAELVDLHAPGVVDAAAIQRIADAVAVSPYRIQGTPLGIYPEAEGVRVSVYIWSSEVHPLIAGQLRTLLAQKPAGKPGDDADA